MEDENEFAPRESRDESVSFWTAVVCIAIFALWSAAVSAAHAVFKQVDGTSAIIAEIGIAPVLVFLFSAIHLSYGDSKLGLQTRRIRDSFAHLKALEVRGLEVKAETDAILPMKHFKTNRAEEYLAALEDSIKANIESKKSSKLDDAPDDVVFVRLRREIEKRLQALSDAYEVPFKPNAQSLLAELASRKIIQPEEAQALAQLIQAGNAQVQGQSTPPGAAELAREQGDRLLRALDYLAQEPQVQLVDRIFEKAEVLDKPISAVQGASGFVIPNEVAIEALSGRPSKLRESLAAVKIRTHIERNEVKGGVFIYSRKPEPLDVTNARKSEYEIGFAWKAGDGFDGDAIARQLAPWLFK